MRFEKSTNLLDIPSFKKGSKIHIKKKNRGKFTEYCGGEVTQKCIDKAKKSGNKTLVKRATFAQNARRWSKKHKDGGEISKYQNGTSNGGIKQDNTRVVKQQEEDAELERILTTLQNSPKEQGLSAADPLLTPIVEGVILGKPLQWLGKGLKTVGKSLLSNSSKKKLVRRTLSDAEKAGIPKGERNSPSPYVRKGTVDEITDDFMSVTSPDVGQFIAKKSEQAVFNHATDPTKVVKVYAVNENGFPNIEAVREFHKHFMKRNQIPFTVKNKFSGYLQGENGIFPYYMQDKVKPLPPMKYTQYEKELLPRLIKQLKTKGYKPIGSDAYSNGKFTITDLTEENMAIDSKGNFIFFDPRVYCLGGKLHK